MVLPGGRLVVVVGHGVVRGRDLGRRLAEGEEDAQHHREDQEREETVDDGRDRELGVVLGLGGEELRVTAQAARDLGYAVQVLEEESA